MADFAGLVEAGKPMRERSDEQKEMDRVAAAAYQRWIDAGRPTLWAKMPVITYFAKDATEAAAFTYLIKRAVQVVEPTGDSTGVRAHFGNQFTLSEQMAEKINRPEEAGKIVIMWAAIDKRKTADDDKRKKTVEAHQAARGRRNRSRPAGPSKGSDVRVGPALRKPGRSSLYLASLVSQYEDKYEQAIQGGTHERGTDQAD